MIPLKEYLIGMKGFSSRLPYLGFVDDGVLLNRSGSLMMSAYYQGNDLESEELIQHEIMSAQCNRILSSLDGGWSINVDSIRTNAILEYKITRKSKAVSDLFSERRLNSVQHDVYKTVSVISLTWDARNIEGDIISEFKQKCCEFFELLKDICSVNIMSSQKMFSYLHYCICGQEGDFAIPNPPYHLNYILGAHECLVDKKLQLDSDFIKAVSIIGFPSQEKSLSTNALDFLFELDFPYRVSHRFMCMDKNHADKVLKDIRQNYFNKQINLWSIVQNMFLPPEDTFYGNDAAVIQSDSIHEAVQANQLDHQRWGYYTGTIIIRDKSPEELKKKGDKISSILNSHGYITRQETYNLLEAFCGSLPGNTLDNVRKPLISVGNLSRLIQLSHLYQGNPYSSNPYLPKKSSCLCIAQTRRNELYHLNLHHKDVGHTMIVGPTGSGKSTLLSVLAMSFLQYPKAKVVVFDKGGSQKGLCQKMDGYYYALGEDQSISFAPFHHLDDSLEREWVKAWLCDVLRLQGIDAITPDMREDIDQALHLLEHDHYNRRMTDFYTALQNKKLKKAILPFLLSSNSIESHLFDDECEDNLIISQFTVLECERLLQFPDRIVIPVLLYMFHHIERILDGSPVMIIIDEWVQMLRHTIFENFFEEKLRELRKRNALIVFATQALTDIERSDLKNVIAESCLSKIYLPNPMALVPSMRNVYTRFGLNVRQIQLIAEAKMKSQYYYSSPEHNRLFSLQLSDEELKLLGVNHA